MKLIATPKNGRGRYGTRHYVTGEEFETPAAYGNVWIGLGLAKKPDGEGVKAPRVPVRPGPEPTRTIFTEDPKAESDLERHVRLNPEREYDESKMAAQTSAAAAALIPGAVVKTPESEASDAHLTAPAPAPVAAVAPKPAPVAEAPKAAPVVDDIGTLRADYEKVFGKKPFMGWKEDELREKIADAKK